MFPTTVAYDRLQAFFKDRIRHDEPLSLHSSFGVGGVADIWITLERREDLISLVQLCAEERWPLLVIGNGSNTIFSEDGVRGIVTRLAMQSFTITEQSQDSALLQVDAGANWPQVAQDLVRQGWAGLEFGIGIPGTLGAGIISNAGAHKRELGESLEWIEVLDARGTNIEQDGISPPMIRRYNKDELDLGYRSSRFRREHESYIAEDGYITLVPREMIEPAEIVLQLGFRLRRMEPVQLEKTLAYYREERRQAEPHQHHSGLVFVDPPDVRAGELIAQAGLAGLTIGRACISEYNANYIVNLGGATSEDLKALATEAYRRVRERFNISLQLNVEFR